MMNTPRKLYYNTVTPTLLEILQLLMSEPLFNPFRLVGGTNLSLRLGHRKSVDIDLFTDSEYDSLNFKEFEVFLKSRFAYYDNIDHSSIVGFGRSYYIGATVMDCIKLDLMYTDKFLHAPDIIDGLRMASLDDIAAMKIDAISRCGRKKDFWDVNKLLEKYSLREMLDLHKRRHMWNHEEAQILRSLIDFSEADGMEDPVCLEGRDWDEIKLTFIDLIGRIL